MAGGATLQRDVAALAHRGIGARIVVDDVGWHCVRRRCNETTESSYQGPAEAEVCWRCRKGKGLEASPNGRRRRTDDFDVGFLEAHGVGVDLAHVPAAVRLVGVGDAQHPVAAVGLRQRQTVVARDHLVVDRQDRVRRHSNPRHLLFHCFERKVHYKSRLDIANGTCEIAKSNVSISLFC